MGGADSGAALFISMLRRNRDVLLALLCAAALAVPLVVLARRVVAGMGIDRPYDVLHVPAPRALRLLSPDVQLTVANLYWLQAVQYVGDRRNVETRLEKLFPIVDLVTELDPRHGYAYQSAGIALSSVGRLDESDRILEKGIRNAPRWSFPFYLAFNHFFYRDDYETAARWAEAAARMPGASERVRQLALTLKVKSGLQEDAVRFLEEMRATAADEQTAASIEEQLRVAVLQRNFAVLDAAVERFRETQGRLPGVLEELVWTGILAALPADPYGGAYYVDPTGRVHSSAKDFRVKPPEKGLGRRMLPPGNP
jgi:tetratricopeptide (TPR) repeat protein